DFVKNVLGLVVIEDRIKSGSRFCRLATFPIGIDVNEFSARAANASASPDVLRLRASLTSKLVIGVDRIDYSKGLPNRVRAFDRLFVLNPELKRKVTMLQIAVPSRGQIRAYNHLQ